MSCDVLSSERNDFYIFDTEKNCDDAVAIINAKCASCNEKCGIDKSTFTQKKQRIDGKFICSVHPEAEKKLLIEGILTNTKEEFISDFDHTIEN